MDPTWGVVIVAVVGVLGTVAGVWLQTRNAARLAADDRLAADLSYRREKLLTAYSAFMDLLADLDKGQFREDHSDSYLNRLFELQRREVELAIWGNPDVCEAARVVTNHPGRNMTEPGGLEFRDRLGVAVRDQLESMRAGGSAAIAPATSKQLTES